MTEHEQLKELLGAYVLNAVPTFERRQVERHLGSCDACRHEVRLLSEAAAELAVLAPDEDAGDIVDRISASLPPRPRRGSTRLAAAVAAAAIAVAAVLGAAFLREDHRSDRLVAIVAQAERRVELASHGGFGGSGTVYVSNDGGAVLLSDMPDAGRGRAYQLWGIDGERPVSMAVMGGDGRLVELFEVDGVPQTFAITIEPSGGSPVPTTDPILSGSS